MPGDEPLGPLPDPRVAPGGTAMTLFQTEWCPSSHRVRQRLTELGVDYVVRQVPVAKEQRRELMAATGTDTIPVLVTADGDVIRGVETILAWLDGHADEAPDAALHRARAQHHRRRDCADLQATTPGATR
jgi:glutathione S-transferase